MTKQEHNKLVDLAKNAAIDAFNAQPYEVRKKLANPLKELREINLLLSRVVIGLVQRTERR